MPNGHPHPLHTAPAWPPLEVNIPTVWSAVGRMDPGSGSWGNLLQAKVYVWSFKPDHRQLLGFSWQSSRGKALAGTSFLWRKGNTQLQPTLDNLWIQWNIWGKIIPNLYNLFYKIAAFCEAIITPILKPDKDCARKQNKTVLQTNISHEHRYKKVSMKY